MTDFENNPEYERAKKRAMYLLGSRDYCRAELKKKLLNNYGEEICDAVIETMTEYGYINEENYAKKLADNLVSVKKYGLRKAKYTMITKGISKTLTEEILSSYSSENMKEEIIAIIRKKYSDCLEERADIQKVMNSLVRRGYDYDDIKASISEVRDNIEFYED